MTTVTDIAAQLQGYDPNALPADKVNEFLTQLVAPITQTEEVGLFDALGRVLAHDVVSPISVPAHDNSAMDGFAFCGADLNATGVSTFKVVGMALAGKAWQGSVRAGECVKIMTGAIMPDGLDTVVPQELCVVKVASPSVRAEPATVRTAPAPVRTEPVEVPAKDPPDSTQTKIEIAPGLLQPGDNRRFRGEDLMQGNAALSKGELLTPASIGLLASLNISHVHVVRKLKVAYFSTGDEVLSLGEPPREGAIYDSNRYTVHGMLTRLGVQVIDMGVVRDDPALLEAAFKNAASQADAIITSGGVSVGEADFTKAMMKKLGDVAFWKIAMRPGRPMAVGKINNAILFGLPGNPVAVMVTMLAFVRPALLRMMGASPAKYASAPLYLQAHSGEALRKKPGRTEYQRGTVTRAADGTLQVKTTGNQGSGVLSSMVQANGLIVLHHAQGNVAVGDVVDVMMFDGAM
jgi:molybdopterin molybdotransferase